MNTAFKVFAVSALVSTSLFANGRPPVMGMPAPFERPVGTVHLSQIDGDGRYPRPEALTLNRFNTSKTYTSFKLVEDTGIRCVTTPCPSETTTKFNVTNVRTTRTGDVVYTADSRPIMIMGIIAPRPGHPAPAVRTIQVIDHSNNRSARHRYQFVLKLKGKFEMNTFGGNLEH